MAQKLEGKVAVVTGAGGRRGIGRAVALALASESAKVVVNDVARDAQGVWAADGVVQAITKANGTAIASYDSVTTMAGGENIIKAATNNFGRIDILVNCAGNFRPGLTLDITEDNWDSIMAVHLKGHFSCTKAAVSEMVKQKSGRIINFSSRSATTGGGNLAYSAAKAAIVGFTSHLAKDLKKYNITVNAILPSAITDLFPQDKHPSADNMPVVSTPDAEYVAPVVVYLATDKAQSITGRFIYAAGGDICLYAAPFKLSATHTFVRKIGKWTVDELSELIPPIVGLG